jgi:hypothetical protein
MIKFLQERDQCPHFGPRIMQSPKVHIPRLNRCIKPHNILQSNTVEIFIRMENRKRSILSLI